MSIGLVAISLVAIPQLTELLMHSSPFRSESRPACFFTIVKYHMHSQLVGDI